MNRLFSNDIPKRIQYLQQLIKQKSDALKLPPHGHIKAVRVGNKYYYHFYDSAEPKSNYLRYLRINDTRDMTLARSIAQRDYDEKVLKLAVKELKLLEREGNFYDNGCADDVFDSLNKGRQALVTPIRMPDEEYIAKWLAQDYPKKKLNPNLPSFESKRGEMMRSKSEAMIADNLLLDDIPYLYEKPVELIDLVTGNPYTAHPDFTVLNISERKIFLWEHFGRCDDPKYMNTNIKKLIEYENAGWHLGENLIVTFETRRFPLTPERIRGVIEYYLK